MSEEIGYSDWDLIVQKAEANLEICDGNLRRAMVGKQVEKVALELALKERAKYPKPPKPELEATKEE